MKAQAIINALQANITGELVVPDEALTDFGRIQYVTPALVLRPQSSQDIATVLQYATKQGLNVSVKGASHTTGGQTLSDGIVIDMTTLRGEIVVDTDLETVTTLAGEYWNTVINQTLDAGLVPPTYSDWLYLTVGGTVSTGGVGQRSFKTGTQADNVVAFELVTPKGEILTCSSVENVDYFNAARGGLGLFGVITRVTFQLETAPQQVCVAKLLFTELADFLAATKQFVEACEVDGIQAHVEPQLLARVKKRMANPPVLSLNEDKSARVFILELSKYVYAEDDAEESQKALESLVQTYATKHVITSDFKDHISRVPPILDPDIAVDGPEPEHHHGCFFVPFEAAAEYLAGEFAHNSPEDDGLGTTLIIPITRAEVNPAHSLAIPQSELSLFVGFLRRQIGGLNSTERLEADFKRSTDAALRLGGNMYICGSKAPKDPSFWHTQFSEQTTELKAAVDSTGYLSPGVGFQPQG